MSATCRGLAREIDVAWLAEVVGMQPNRAQWIPGDVAKDEARQPITPGFERQRP